MKKKVILIATPQNRIIVYENLMSENYLCLSDGDSAYLNNSTFWKLSWCDLEVTILIMVKELKDVPMIEFSNIMKSTSQSSAQIVLPTPHLKTNNLPTHKFVVQTPNSGGVFFYNSN